MSRLQGSLDSLPFAAHSNSSWQPKPASEDHLTGRLSSEAEKWNGPGRRELRAFAARLAISGHGGLRLCSDEAVVASGPTVAQRHEDFSQLCVLQGCGWDVGGPAAPMYCRWAVSKRSSCRGLWDRSQHEHPPHFQPSPPVPAKAGVSETKKPC